MQICAKCGLEQPLDNFGWYVARGKRRQRVRCRTCERLYFTEYRVRNADRIKARKKRSYEHNKAAVLEQQRQYRARTDSEQKRASQREYRNKNKVRIAESKKIWATSNAAWVKSQQRQKYLANRDAILSQCRAYRLRNPQKRKEEYQRCRFDLQWRLRSGLRTRLNRAIRSDYKAGSAIRDLGCSIEEFKAYLESQFQPGMTWNNWGRGKGNWGIDHIMPLAAFDLQNRQHFLLAAYYLNMQPLWCEDNSSKCATIPTNENTTEECLLI